MKNELTADDHRLNAGLLKQCFAEIKATRVLEPVLYHYTNSDTFLKIVESRELWLTHISGMNDSSEVRHGFRLFTDEVARRNRSPDKKAWAPIYAELLSHAKNGITLPNIYVACFSAKPNDLSQWRAYGNAAGYALGFDSTIMQDNESSFSYLFGPIIYNEEHKLNAVSVILDCIEHAANRGNTGDLQLSRSYIKSLVATWIRNLHLVLAFLKNAAFESEHEFRIATDLVFHMNARLEFRHRGVMLRSHLPFPVRSRGESLERTSPLLRPLYLTNIMVGPTVHEDEARVTVKQFLEARGHKGWNEHGDDRVVVDSSKIPLRNL